MWNIVYPISSRDGGTWDRSGGFTETMLVCIGCAVLYLLGPSHSSSYMTSSQPTGSAKQNHKQTGDCSVVYVSRRRRDSVLRYVTQMLGI